MRGESLDAAPTPSHHPLLLPAFSLAAQTARASDLERSLAAAVDDAARWRAAADAAATAAEQAGAAGPAPGPAPGDPSREDALAAALAEKTLEGVALRRTLAAATARAAPSVAQARQLALDPAVAREFERLRADAAASARDAASLRERLAALPGAPGAEAVVARFHELQRENEELRVAAGEGAKAAAERRAAAAEALLADARASEAAAAAALEAALTGGRPQGRERGRGTERGRDKEREREPSRDRRRGGSSEGAGAGERKRGRRG